jgi:hypothetical protein
VEVALVFDHHGRHGAIFDQAHRSALRGRDALQQRASERAVAVRGVPARHDQCVIHPRTITPILPRLPTHTPIAAAHVKGRAIHFEGSWSRDLAIARGQLPSSVPGPLSFVTSPIGQVFAT